MMREKLGAPFFFCSQRAEQKVCVRVIQTQISLSITPDLPPCFQVQRQRPSQRPRPVLGQVGQGGRAGPRGVRPRGAGEERGERQ